MHRESKDERERKNINKAYERDNSNGPNSQEREFPAHIHAHDPRMSMNLHLLNRT